MFQFFLFLMQKIKFLIYFLQESVDETSNYGKIEKVYYKI